MASIIFISVLFIIAVVIPSGMDQMGSRILHLLPALLPALPALVPAVFGAIGAADTAVKVGGHALNFLGAINSKKENKPATRNKAIRSDKPGNSITTGFVRYFQKYIIE